VIGLTGSIGMGKTTAAAMLRRLGLPVHDADAEVHRLQAPGGPALPAIGAAFPGTVRDGVLDREGLRRALAADPRGWPVLERILHPLVRAAEERFLARARAAGRRAAVLDIPLLFETGAERRCDVVITVTAPAFVQRARVLRRPGMTPARLAAMLARQTPDAEKRRRADFVVDTGHGRRQTLRTLAKILRILMIRGRGTDA
jgi:dephospho-CoA kinase